MTLDVRQDRTALRLKLYQNGFSPLANKRKLCLVRGWSTIEITPALINSRDWVRSRAFMDTGLRCGEIVALDFDIDDKDLLNAFLDEIVENNIVEESPFVRIGKPPRELWVYRTASKIGKRTTGHFMPAGTEEGNGYAVEVLGKGCQFAAFGQRDAETNYAWPVESPLDHVYMDLPEITLEQAEAVRDTAAAFFERHGLERKSPAGGTDAGYTHAYDLTPEQVFDIKDMGELTVSELTEMLRLNPEEVLRAKADAFRPTSGSWACMVSLVNGDLCVSDHGTYTSHFPLDADATGAMARLGVLLAERFPEPVEAPVAFDPAASMEMDPHNKFDDNLAAALNRYVYVVNDGLIADLGNNFITQKTRLFHDSMRNYFTAKQGKLGGETIVRLSDQWLDSPRRLTATTMQMRPDMARPLFREHGTLNVNTYDPIIHDAVGGNAKPGLFMIQNLLPIEEERVFFMRWLAFKYAHPEVPGPAIVMVARDSYGTGRGSLIALLTDIFGQRYVNPVDFATLTGQGSQSQYNEWQSDSLLITVDEAKETPGTLSSWQTRSNAYEHLKNIVDPSGRGVHVKRKGVKNTKEQTYASILIATNHGDAFVLPANDRRIAVLENGEPMPPQYWLDFHAWRHDRANVAAFVRELERVDLEGYNPYAAPIMTAAKADMVESGSSEMDRALAHALAGLTDTLVVKEQVVLRVEEYLADTDVEVPDDWRRMIERMLARKTRKTPIGIQDRVRIEGKQRVVRMLGKPGPAILASSQTMIDEILRNGQLSRQVKTRDSVIHFPGRKEKTG